jgi:hypothetical protein
MINGSLLILLSEFSFIYNFDEGYDSNLDSALFPELR